MRSQRFCQWLQFVVQSVCVCTCSDEDVTRPCRKTSFEDLSASELTVLLTCHFQSTARKMRVPFFTNRCYQKLNADHKSLVQKSHFQISAVTDALMSVEVCVSVCTQQCWFHCRGLSAFSSCLASTVLFR